MTNSDEKRVDLLLRVMRLSRHPDAAATVAAMLDMLERDFTDLPTADVVAERAVAFAFRMRLCETAPDSWSAFLLETQTETERVLATWDNGAARGC